MKSLLDIKSILERHKNRLYNNYPIKSMAIFGSYSRSNQKEDSDIDIIVEFNGNIGIRFVDLADEIEDLLGAKVDLVSRNGIKDRYYQAINSDLIYV